MNANELAELIEHLENAKYVGASKAATMLRQQQAEIEALKEPKMPLLEQEIRFILGHGQCWQGEDCSMPNLMYIIRAVEAAHGIGVKQDEQ
jgi:hypothetical protein